MEVVGWIIAYVILFALLHLLLYVMYLRRRDEDGSLMPSLIDGNGTDSRYHSGSDALVIPGEETDQESEFEKSTPLNESASEPERDYDIEFSGETVQCHRCGVTNEADQAFTYCWNCISTLR